MGYMNPESIRDTFLALLGEDNQLTFQKFNRFFVDLVTEDEDEPVPGVMEFPEAEEVRQLGRLFVTGNPQERRNAVLLRKSHHWYFAEDNTVET